MFFMFNLKLIKSFMHCQLSLKRVPHGFVSMELWYTFFHWKLKHSTNCDYPISSQMVVRLNPRLSVVVALSNISIWELNFLSFVYLPNSPYSLLLCSKFPLAPNEPQIPNTYRSSTQDSFCRQFARFRLRSPTE